MHTHTHAQSKTGAFGTTIISALFALVMLGALTSCTHVKESSFTTTVYLVRHAEKITTPDIGPNPELTEAGAERAKILAGILADKGITRVHSSDFLRTKNTAGPLATKLGLEVETYDPYDMSVIIAQIKKQGGTHLLVGHSNTTPEAVIRLGGKTQPEINEANEYDRLYTVTIAKGGSVQTELMRYGALYVAED